VRPANLLAVIEQGGAETLCPRCGRTFANRARCPWCFPAAEGAAGPLGADETLLVSQEPAGDARSDRLPSLAATLIDGPSRGGPGAGRDEGEADESTGPLAVGSPFGPRYLILKLLGAGGMGAVYQAWDQELGVPVALKVIRTEMLDPTSAAEIGARFKRELLLAREVTHKNVVRIHDLGDIDGIKYFTMTYIEGEDLSTLLARVGRLPVGRALEIFRQIVDGMIAAHEKGIVHRDLKPGNVMIDKQGDALLMDFGIARSEQIRPTHTPHPGAGQRLAEQTPAGLTPAGLTPAGLTPAGLTPAGRTPPGLTPAGLTPPASGAPQGPPGSDAGGTFGASVVHLGATRVGAMVGTPEYMAPEQYLGEVADSRADVYALGLILYDMLLGRRRTRSGRKALQEVRHRVRRPPPSARTIDPTIPEALDRLIDRCLQPEPADRFQSTVELAQELALLDAAGEPLPRYSRRAKALGALVVTAVLGAPIVTYFLARGDVALGPREPMSVLVADLDNETGDESFDGAFEQALAIAMEGGGFINVYPRGSAQQIAERLQPGSGLDPTMSRLISRREGIEAILIGAIEPAGRGYRVEVRAVDPTRDAGEAAPLARARARSPDREGVLATIGELASELRRELGDTATESARLAAAETVTAASLEAMRRYAAGQDLFYQGRFEEAIAEFEGAVEEDSGFGRAYAGMGAAYANLQQQERAEAAYQQALQNLDRMTERERYRTLGGYYLIVSRNYPKAIENYQTLVELYPADRAGHANLALASLYSRDFRKAMDEGAKAVALEPNNAVQRVNLAMYAIYAGDFQRALEESEKLLADNPDFGYARLALARAASGLGDLERARGEYRALAGAGGLGQLAWVGLADLELYRGRPGEALRTLESAAEAGASGSVLAVVRAEALAAAGDDDEAAGEAQRAIAATSQENVLYPASRVLIAGRRLEPIPAVVETLDAMLQSQTLAYARLLEGETAIVEGRLPDALEALRAGQGRYDIWLAHLLLGRAYLEARQYAEAVDELTYCVERRGEVTDVFLADQATLRYYPQALDLLGRAQLGIGDRVAARQSLERYLEIRRGGDDIGIAAVEELLASL
jgi:serine/threonine protein kinase/Flp pilus assembly protein TadD